MQVNNYSDKSTTFGMIYSKSTIKSLKKIIPQVIKNEGFENAHDAIKNLQKLGKRNDNLIVDLTTDGDHWYDIEPGVKLQKNSPFKYFVYPTLPQGVHFLTTKYQASPFKFFIESLAKEEFVKASHDKINQHAKFLKERTIKEKFNDKLSKIRESIEDGADWVNEKFSIYEYYSPREMRYKKRFGFWLDMKDYMRHLNRKIHNRTPEDIITLRKEIDKLPTK